MATSATVYAMYDGHGQTVHPFFGQPRKVQETVSNRSQSAVQIESHHDYAHHNQGTMLAMDISGSRPESNLDGASEDVLSADQGGQRQGSMGGEIHDIIHLPVSAIDGHSTLGDQDMLPRKRRKVGTHQMQVQDRDITTDRDRSSEIVPDGPDRSVQVETSLETSPVGLTQALETPSELPPSHEAGTAGIAPRTPPKKMLKLNKAGKFSSPVSKVPLDLSQPPKEVSRKARKRKEVRHLIAVYRYGQTANAIEIGNRITRILDGQERVAMPEPSQTVTTPKKRTPNKTVRTPKVTHPFFLGKAIKADETQLGTAQGGAGTETEQVPSPIRKPSAATPGKLRAQAREYRASLADHVRRPEEDRPAARKPQGLYVRGMEAPWPSKGTSHLRGLDEKSLVKHDARITSSSTTAIPPSHLKMKNKLETLDTSENVLESFKNRLDFDQAESIREDGFSDAPESLRVPDRLLISGPRIQEMVRDQVEAYSSIEQSPGVSAIHNNMRQSPGAVPMIHPVLTAMYDSIADALTPYDNGRSEIQAWTQKYCPKRADHVLQRGPEAQILTRWLHSLTVMAVDGPSSAVSKTMASQSRPKKKRRKRTQGLDDFIVSSDDDDRQMEELPTSQMSSSSNQAPGVQSRTMVCSSLLQPEQAVSAQKAANAVLISGPHSCGKTAMVFAAARELGFEVFEINPGSRRSGKDVLERVGDMIGNHLVQHHGGETGNTSADEESSRLTTALKQDLESGRQGTMNAFFKPKTHGTKAKPTAANVAKDDKAEKPQQKHVHRAKPAKQQKQSLILLEEVDVLFEEDRGFWSTVLMLILNSKRPVVLTCTNESTIPFDEIKFHALLRLPQPEKPLAVDYMLLLAAREGHILSRDAVSSLFDSRNGDLRASITQLQFWCQMAVGDVRGGLSWIYQRWPPGSGVDDQGKELRVVSKGTVHTGIGCFASDLSRDDMLEEAWKDWSIDPRDVVETRALSLVDAGFDAEIATPQSRMAALDNMLATFELLSVTDVVSRIGLPRSRCRGETVETFDDMHQVTLDPTLPDMTAKERLSYVESSQLLQADDRIDYERFDVQFALTASSHISDIYSTPENHILPNHAQGLWRTIRERQSYGMDDTFTRLDRHSFDDAFGPISEAPVTATTTYTGPQHSCLDSTLSTVAKDVAPYVRSIVQYDVALEELRLRLGSLLNGNPVTGKRARTTRAARSALEGGQRQSTRRDRWFDAPLDVQSVLATGGRDWPKTAVLHSAETGSITGTPEPSQPSLEMSQTSSI